MNAGSIVCNGGMIKNKIVRKLIRIVHSHHSFVYNSDRIKDSLLCCKVKDQWYRRRLLNRSDLAFEAKTRMLVFAAMKFFKTENQFEFFNCWSPFFPLPELLEEKKREVYKRYQHGTGIQLAPAYWQYESFHCIQASQIRVPLELLCLVK